MNGEDKFFTNLYQRFPINLDKGKGAFVWDTEGKKYIDCMGGYGVALVGHCNDRVVRAIHEQVDKLITCHMSVFNNTRLKFLEKLGAIVPGELDKFFFSNSGAEAIEAALKFSRKYTSKPGVISTYGGYHGKTFGALSVTYNEKYRKPFTPLLDGVKFVPYNDPLKIKEAVDDSTGAVILEPIQGETGIIVPSEDYLQQVREICNQKGILLIFDEIQAGLGRTGKFWACENWNTIPDILCLAKGIAGGMPMGLTITKSEIMQSMKIGEHSSTFAGNPLACAAGIATVDALVQDKLVENAATTGKYFREKLLELKDRHKIIREVRGMGMMIGVELRFDIKEILFEGINNGLLLLYSGRNILRLLPPLVMDQTTVSQTIEIMDRLLYNEEKRRNVV